MRQKFREGKVPEGKSTGRQMSPGGNSSFFQGRQKFREAKGQEAKIPREAGGKSSGGKSSMAGYTLSKNIGVISITNQAIFVFVFDPLLAHCVLI